MRDNIVHILSLDRSNEGVTLCGRHHHDIRLIPQAEGFNVQEISRRAKRIFNMRHCKTCKILYNSTAHPTKRLK